MLPAPIFAGLRQVRSRQLPSFVIELARLHRCSAMPLPTVAARGWVDLPAAWRAGDRFWPDVARRAEAAGLVRNPLGVSTGDRRALVALAAYLSPDSVLEIGTHIGSSTLAWAATLKGTDAKVTTVDICQVNDLAERPWERYNARVSPAELVADLSAVEFVTADSLSYLQRTTDRYDLIFLDGDHGAATVYRELPMALSRLRADGVILLHDYYPGGRRLVPGSNPAFGPYLAIRRLVSEGLRVRVLPLGELPWHTTRGRTVTSLALVLRA